MAEYGIEDYMAKAHVAQLVREAAIARGVAGPGRVQSTTSFLKNLFTLLFPHG